ncbi:Transcription factor TFIIH subunit p52/Tfb2 like protein, partial [Aduncisulcus paluster]
KIKGSSMRQLGGRRRFSSALESDSTTPGRGLSTSSTLPSPQSPSGPESSSQSALSVLMQLAFLPICSSYSLSSSNPPSESTVSFLQDISTVGLIHITTEEGVCEGEEGGKQQPDIQAETGTTLRFEPAHLPRAASSSSASFPSSKGPIDDKYPKSAYRKHIVVRVTRLLKGIVGGDESIGSDEFDEGGQAGSSSSSSSSSSSASHGSRDTKQDVDALYGVKEEEEEPDWMNESDTDDFDRFIASEDDITTADKMKHRSSSQAQDNGGTGSTVSTTRSTKSAVEVSSRHHTRSVTAVDNSFELYSQLPAPPPPARILVETNFRLYLYTHSETHRIIVSWFSDVVFLLPGLCVCQITNESIIRAAELGLNEESIASFLSHHAHPASHTRAEGQQLPLNVLEQMVVWFRELKRLKKTSNCVYIGNGEDERLGKEEIESNKSIGTESTIEPIAGAQTNPFEEMRKKVREEGELLWENRSGVVVTMRGACIARDEFGIDIDK